MLCCAESGLGGKPQQTSGNSKSDDDEDDDDGDDDDDDDGDDGDDSDDDDDEIYFDTSPKSRAISLFNIGG